ncbi:MAG: methyltransferase domain-containing protein [Alphaproteobacteria bacterium]|nr:methyltransferase domain-containing protein [Alphaproteobacteria bacterium]
MNGQDFDFVADLLKKRAGIVLTADKTYLLESRLAPLARKEGLPSIDDLIEVVRTRREERLVAQLVDVMTASETYFFRDRTPFVHLREAVLPALAEVRRGGRIRIWCAACSTGQEAYSIAMMLDQNPSLTDGVPVEIVATDISDRSLEKARAGLYSQFEVQRGLPIQMLMNYFTQQDDHWRISERLRGNVAFRKQNLIEPFTQLGKFDVVLCRNVLVNFDHSTKADVLNRIAEQMAPGGYLMLGAPETVVGVSTAFEASLERRGLYRTPQKAVKAA